jgi:hypothetical protein
MIIKTISLFLFFYNFCISQQVVPFKVIAPYAMPSTQSDEDPNLNPSWDWNKGDLILNGAVRYVVFFQKDEVNAEEAMYAPPWNQGDYWPGLYDRFPEDGWELLARDFGSPSRRIAKNGNVYFLLYNKFRSILRVFVLLRPSMINGSFKYGTMELSWSNPAKVTGGLNSLSAYWESLNNIVKTKNNASISILKADPIVDNWVYADFPIAHDNSYIATSTINPPSMKISIKGVSVADINMKLEGFAAQGDSKFMQKYLTGHDNGSINFSANTNNLPQLSIPFDLLNTNLSATQKDWSGTLDYFKDVKLQMPVLSEDNPFKKLFDDFGDQLNQLSASLPFSIGGIDIVGLYKYFSGGGMKTNYIHTAPTYTSSQFVGTGSIIATSTIGSVTIPFPASRINYKDTYDGGDIGLANNSPVGIFTVKNQIIVYRKPFSLPLRHISGVEIQVPMYEYELTNLPELAFNDNTNLELIKTEISLVAPFIPDISPYLRSRSMYDFLRYGYSILYMAKTAENPLNQKSLFEFDAPISDNGGYFRSLPVPLKLSRGRTLIMPKFNIYNEVNLRIKAILKRKDAPLAQPVVFISSYNVLIEDKINLPTYVPLPTIPPQEIKCTIPATGGVKISWNRNYEKNVSRYYVERSINGGNFVNIGSTKDTVITDEEIQKSVKPYITNRQNVVVGYRVRAKSEWIDDGVNKYQYSDYSDIINISGSILIAFNKFGTEQITPGSHSISQNFPNPFNPSTTIYYGVKENAHVNIKVFNALGQEVATLVNDLKEVGYHYAEWNAAGLPSGMYFYRITAGDYTETKKMTLMK